MFADSTAGGSGGGCMGGPFAAVSACLGVGAVAAVHSAADIPDTAAGLKH